jgi:AcrR family transcriptional regulator
VGLSEDAVVAAGAALAHREGLDAVSVRAVAGELAVTPMALYRHIADADALHAAVVERLLADLPVVGVGGGWDERCRTWAHGARAVLAPVHGLARHVLMTWIHLPRVLVALEGLVALLERDGPPGVDAVAGANAVLVHVLMRAQAEEAVRTGGIQRDLSTLRSLRAELPSLWAHREEYRRARLDEHFAYGLDALLLGMATARRTS